MAEDLTAAKDKRKFPSGERMPHFRSTEQLGMIFFFCDSDKQWDYRNSGHDKYPVELSKSSIKNIESSPAVSGILDK
jgi:hypothetical protein